MEEHKQVLRMGAAVVILAIVLRLIGAGFFSPVRELIENPKVLSFFVYLQTGRVVRYNEAQIPETVPEPNIPPVESLPQEEQPQEEQPQEEQPKEPEPEKPKPVQPVRPVFGEEDLSQIGVTYRCGYRPTLAPLLSQPLDWSLTGDSPSVLIIHTHATESYEKQPGENYVEDVTYRTRNEAYNMVSIGDEVARILEEGGITVLHDRSFHDYPSYNGSYNNARNAIMEYLEKYPSIQMVLDIHRDASDGANGQQMVTAATVNGEPSAQVMVVVGTDESGNYHPNWRGNLSVGLKLTAVMERQTPGITRPLTLRSERFNMDLTAASLLIEVGAAGDTHAQAMVAAGELARGILALANGACLQNVPPV